MGASRRHIMYAVEASLRRLQTDRIDIYYVHRFDDRTALEQTLRALDDLVRQGKIVYTGASNFAAWQVAKALGLSAKEGLASVSCIQPMVILLKRGGVEILPGPVRRLNVFTASRAPQASTARPPARKGVIVKSADPLRRHPEL
jgi:aryl-alcohol dehydrogenase-like predicted oxidoreductase